jgi:hypothetical protein
MCFLLLCGNSQKLSQWSSVYSVVRSPVDRESAKYFGKMRSLGSRRRKNKVAETIPIAHLRCLIAWTDALQHATHIHGNRGIKDKRLTSLRSQLDLTS